MLFLCPEVQLVLAIFDVSLEEMKGKERMGACTFLFSEKAADGPAFTFKVEVVLASKLKQI